MYKVDFPALATGLLPTLLRKTRLVALAQAALDPVRQRYGSFLLYADYVRLQLSYNGQTIMLEKALNDTFDPRIRRIRIDATGAAKTPFYLNFLREDQPEKYLYRQAEARTPRYLYSQAVFLNPISFTVLVPLSLAPAPDMTEADRAFRAGLEGFIQRLKLATTVHRTIYQ